MDGEFGNEITTTTVPVSTFDDRYHLTADRSEDRLVIRGDLPGVTRDRLSVEAAGNKVQIDVDGETVGRVPVAWDSARATEVSFQNGVLSVTLLRAK